MRLKKIEIAGFKSFAERVGIGFDADIVALVGPNGCGKSNIVDALLWVLGEQSAKSLRAEKMHDVLFAGAEDMKQSNIAEISLTLTECDSPIGDEIVITRRLYRDGEMHYLINRKEARLKDVQELFLGSGVGKNGFFVFEQGKIEEIISLSPEKRRAIFEETAGISLFLQKKKETLSELVEVEKNTNRIKDLHGEVERQWRSLEKQAEQAKSYKEKKDRLDKLERGILLFKKENVSKLISEAEKKGETIEKKLQETEKKIALIEQDLQEMKKEEEEEAKKEALQSEFFQVQSGLKLAEVELKGVFDSQFHVEEREKRARLEKERLASKRQEKSQEAKESEKELSKLLEKKKSIETKKEQKEELACGIEKELEALLSKEKQEQKAFLECLQKESALKSQIEAKEGKKEGLFQMGKNFENEIKKKEKGLSEIDKKIEEKRTEVEALSSLIAEEKKEIETHEKAGSALTEALVLKNQEKERLLSEISTTRAQEKTLLQLQEEHAGFSQGAKWLLKEAQNAKSALFGKVEEIYHHVDIETTKDPLRFYEETLVVQTPEAMEEILSFAQVKKIGDFSFVLLEDLKALRKNLDALSPLKGIKEAFIERKKRKEQEHLIQGHGFVDRYGVVFYRGDNEKSIFSRVSEIKEKKKALEALEKSKGRLEEEIGTLLKKRASWETTRSALDERRRKKEMTLLQENFYLQRQLEDLKDGKKEIAELEKKLKSHSLTVEQNEKEKLALVALFKKMQEEKRAITEATAELEAKLQKRRKESEKASKECLEVNKELELFVIKERALKEKITIFEIKKEEEEKEEKRLTYELADSALLKKRLAEKEIELEKEKKSLIVAKEKIENLLVTFERDVKERRGRRKEVEALLSQEKKEMKELEKEGHKIALFLTEKKTVYEGLDQPLRESGVSSEDNLEMALDEAEKEVKRLRSELESGSMINMAAISECDVEKKRFEELDRQLQDMQGARGDLEKIIGKLEKESRKLFKATFDKVRENFQKNFRTLFEGGEGDLILINEEKILEAGVEIVACPPGKKPKALSLLSGGEKCMTTLALLFALFEVKPAPFCILDEVDAPLDEVNVTRFTTLLKQFVPKTQFIMVTHNKKTMAAADTLVGVSMEKKGVSKLISLALTTKKEAMAH